MINTLRANSQEIKRITQEKNEGIIHFLPFPERMGRLGQLLGGIGKRDYILISAGTGDGKSTLMYDITENFAHEFLDTHENADIKLTIFRNILEEDESTLALKKLSGRLKEKGHDISLQKLQGRSLDSFTDDIIELINETTEEMICDIEKYGDKVEIRNYSIGNPFGFYNEVRKYYAETGTFYKDGEPVEVGQEFHEYVPDNPNELVIVASDHLKLYTAESGKSWYATIDYFSRVYCRRILNLKMGAATINVQQQSSQSSSTIFTKDGKKIIENTYPTMTNLGDITVTSRDATVVIGIWNPHKHDVDKQVINGVTFPYIQLLERDKPCRVLFLLKNRYGGREGSRLPVTVDFQNSRFYEIPKTEREISNLLNQ